MAPTIFSEHDGRYLSFAGDVRTWSTPPEQGVSATAGNGGQAAGSEIGDLQSDY